jgi:LmbE family N-acetylglucosaminyl deacetylase
MMPEQLKLMCVLAHPDDESMGTGGILSKYAAEGVATYLVCATRGERGWMGDPEASPGLEALGRMREAELLQAARVLGLKQVEFLDYIDGELDEVNPVQAIARIAKHVRKIRPQVVVTFPPDGAYGHPDHIAISQFTAAALVRAADCNYDQSNGYAPYQVSKLYYVVDSHRIKDIIAGYIGELAMEVDGVKRGHIAWEDWAITTQVDATAYWQTAWQAIKCHHTQVQEMVEMLDDQPEAIHQDLWGRQSLYRVYSLVNGGRRRETDLFEGLRRDGQP